MKDNYLVIQGWMVSELNLSGNDLLAYALIYGFSQDGETEFTGSINYLCKWLNCSRPTAIKSLKFLTEKNLIIKNVNTINGVSFNRYKISLGVVKNINGGSKETLLGGSKETLPNNTTINNTNNNIEAHPLKKFISDNLPTVSKLEIQLTNEQCEKLIGEFNKDSIKDILESMENSKQLTKKYKSVNLTIRSWIKTRQQNNPMFGKIETFLPNQSKGISYFDQTK
jgi:hypothetical protein